MQIDDLRKMGRRLFEEISGLGYSDKIRISASSGAGGDVTFGIDKIAEDIILDGLKALNVPLTAISEEAGIIDMNGGGPKVIIDPIDGSKNAVSDIPFYCTSIAVAEGDRVADIRLAYIINLISGDEFWAVRDGGAFKNNEKISSQKDDTFYMVAYEAQSPGRDISAIMPVISRSRKTRCFGATALDLAYLAAGAISVFISPSPSRSFDFAAGWLIVKEAGGIFTDTEGKTVEQVRLGLELSTPLLASGNKGLHLKTLKLLGAPGS
jgi:myo-inositol-1(or 4)-monophosphatase